MNSPAKKRRWIYAQPPLSYEMCCDKCRGTNIDWSEWEGMIWCYDCLLDTKGDGGVFSGPIPVEAAQVLGMSFDRIDLKTQEVLKFGTEEWKKIAE